jgi:predicted esterase
MIKKNIETTKTARYFLSGNFTELTEKVLIACHGYGELAEIFLKSFDTVDKNKVLVIAPEGLHRFYTKGFFGNIGASWMTKEDRLNEINDYVKFLDKIYNDEIELRSNRKIIKTAFGFSQGTATVCRWFINTRAKIDDLILWGGGVPNDIDLEEYKAKLNSVRLKILIGDKDPFITSEHIESEKRKLTDQGIDHELIVYEGGHKIKAEILVAAI